MNKKYFRKYIVGTLVISIILLGLLAYTIHGKIKEVTFISYAKSLNHAVNLRNLEMLTYWTTGITDSVNVTAKLKGKIINIETDGVVEEHGWTSFDYALKIRIEKNNDSNDIFFTKDELQKTKFIQDNTPISYKALKINDDIEIYFIFDLTKEFENNFVSAEVVKT